VLLLVPRGASPYPFAIDLAREITTVPSRSRAVQTPLRRSGRVRDGQLRDSRSVCGSAGLIDAAALAGGGGPTPLGR
jgi:hypothetical protein